jgi:hypothetical protein
MLITDISLGVQDLYGRVNQTTLNRHIAAAVREYNRWNPRILESTVTVIADTTLYSLALLTGITDIKEVRYFPGGTYYSESRVQSENVFLSAQPERYHVWSQRIIDDIEQAESIKMLSGQWYYRKATNQLKIADTPASGGDTITIFYYASHVINDGGTGYDTIPDDDLDIIVDLALARIYRGLALTAAGTPDYREGQESETFNHVAQNIESEIARLTEGVRHKYGSGAFDVGP